VTDTSSDVVLTLQQACEVVSQGGVVVYPTETVWGVGGDALRPEVVDRVLEVKGIEKHRPFPVLISDMELALDAADGPIPGFAKLADMFWPGGLTIVVPIDDSELSSIAGPGGTVGFRISANPIATTLAESCGGYLVSTSANLSGAPPPAMLEQIDSRLLVRADGAVGRGLVCAGMPSTVLLYGNEQWRVVREGAIPAEVIGKVVDIST